MNNRFVKIFFMQNQNSESLPTERLAGKNIVLGVCGSIAVYKAAELASLLVRGGANVRTVMTESAAKLMSPRIFQTLTRNDVSVCMWKEVESWKPEHISLADFADALLVAPATANTIANFANGLAGDTLACVYLATKAPVLVAPAMNSNMYSHPAVQANIDTLRKRGVRFVQPACGRLACGAEGVGRLADPAEIARQTAELFGAG